MTAAVHVLPPAVSFAMAEFRSPTGRRVDLVRVPGDEAQQVRIDRAVNELGYTLVREWTPFGLGPDHSAWVIGIRGRRAEFPRVAALPTPEAVPAC